MEESAYSGGYDDPLLAERHDSSVVGIDDVESLRSLVGDDCRLRILECSCRTGRMLLPLARDGHVVTGIDISEHMIARARLEACVLGPVVAGRAMFRVQDVLSGRWGSGYDVVVLGGHCLYELPSMQTQEHCIHMAHDALAEGGRLFVDNRHRLNETRTHQAFDGRTPKEVWAGAERPESKRVTVRGPPAAAPEPRQ